MKVVVSEFLPTLHVDRLREHHEVVYDPDLYADRPRLLAETATASAILTRNRTQVDEELIAAASQLRVVGRLGVGLDNIDLNACREAGVEVRPAVGGNAVAVAEYVMGAMLVLVRGVYSMSPSMVAGEWPRQGHAFGNELSGKTLGLVGFGSIARHVATRAAGFGMRITASDPLLPPEDPAWEGAERLDLGALLGGADVVSIHIPLTDDTRGLIDAAAIDAMKPGAVLIDTARGGIVDESAVARSLRDGRLGGAAIDVFAHEPLHPAAAAIFDGAPNLILTPHLAGNTEEAVDRIATTIVDAVLAVLAT